MLGALIIHGVVPGPIMFETNPEIPYGLFVGMILAQFMMLVIGYLIIKPAKRIVLLVMALLSVAAPIVQEN